MAQQRKQHQIKTASYETTKTNQQTNNKKKQKQNNKEGGDHEYDTEDNDKHRGPRAAGIT